ncbi:MAG: hypothetical protein JO261_02470 [Alphaproteobacteria bacterium]|nr:hypothetical protein [Alphaproteobacteria bacterium]MBV9692542.1 hypothetical protein [Alphaproteobacteria bacterium]
MTELDKWDSFTVIVGSAAGALIGLQFVVMTLIAVRPPRRAAEVGPAFSTPTIVHFCSVLLLCAVLRAPWDGVAPAAIATAIVGALGTVYAVVTGWRIRRQNVYAADFEDLLCHVILPVLAYAMLFAGALASLRFLHEGLFAISAAVLLLLFTAIHNAWDAVVYQVLTRPAQGSD